MSERVFVSDLVNAYTLGCRGGGAQGGQKVGSSVSESTHLRLRVWGRAKEFWDLGYRLLGFKVYAPGV